MKSQNAAHPHVRVMPLVAVTAVNYAAQVPYYLHNDYSMQHPLPGVRAIVLLGATLLWFVVGLTGFIRRRRWGMAVLVSFLVTEAVFYAATIVTGIFLFQVSNPSDLLKVVFVVGYISGATAAGYSWLLLRSRLRRTLTPQERRAALTWSHRGKHARRRNGAGGHACHHRWLCPSPSRVACQRPGKGTMILDSVGTRAQRSVGVPQRASSQPEVAAFAQDLGSRVRELGGAGSGDLLVVSFTLGGGR